MDPGIEPDAASAGPEDAGFSLIELLVVIAVLGVLAVGVSLAAFRRDGGAQGDAALFVQSFSAARQLAVQGQETRGLEIGQRSRRALHLRAGQWEPAGPEARWRGRVAFMSADAGVSAGQPRIVFLPNGRTSAFSVQFSDGGARGPVRCTSDGWTGVSCEAP